MTRRPARRLLLLLALAPALLPLWQIVHFGVDIPAWDQFDDDLAGLHVKAHRGTLTFADLAAQHNEHRILVPRLVFLALGYLTHGNSVAEMLAAWAITVATSLVLLRLGNKALAPPGPDTAPPVAWWFLANLLLFSPVQYENWLWGIGVENVLPMLWTALAILAAVSAWRLAVKLPLLVVAAALATWSSGNGMLAWGLAGGVLLWAPTGRELRAHWPRVLLLAAVIALVLVVYFTGMAPPNHRGLQPYDSSVAAKIHYFVAFAGAPFAAALATPPVVTATVLGALLLAVLGACLARFIQSWREGDPRGLCRRTLPWVAIAGFAVGSGLIAAVARAGIGPEQATSSRYVTFALHLPLALLVLVPLLEPWRLFLRRAGSDSQRAAPLIAATSGAAVLLLFALAALAPALRASEATRLARRQTRAAAVLSTLLPEHALVTSSVFPDATVAERNVRGLDDIGYLRPRLVRSPEARRLVAATPPPAERCGRLEQAWEIAPGEVALTGWAALPRSDRRADVVLLCVADDRGEPLIVEMAPVFAPRPELASALGEAAGACGWALRAPVERFLRLHRPATVTAWAFDAGHRELFPLAGTVTFGQ